MAEETIDKAIKAGLLEEAECVTSHLKLAKKGINNSSDRLQIYGDHSIDIEKMISENPSLGSTLNDRLPYTKAEILWICRNEMPLTLEDILARRTRSLFLNARVSADIAPEVARLMAGEFGYDQIWQKEQVEAYNELVKNYI
jgi:glycerol-3-phosphate dehydrogenase